MFAHRFMFSLNCLQVNILVWLTKVEQISQEQEGGEAQQHAAAAGKKWSGFWDKPMVHGTVCRATDNWPYLKN